MAAFEDRASVADPPTGNPACSRQLVVLITLALAAGTAFATGVSGKVDPVSAEPELPECPAAVETLRLTVVVDNVPGREDLGTGWGLSVLVETGEATVLFDTGPDGDLLLSNMKKLEIDPRHIDAVFLSHDHGDHTGGLRAFLEVRPEVPVYLLGCFRASTKQVARAARGGVVEVAGPLSLLPGVCTMGRFEQGLAEQSLLVHTPHGLVVLTGCAHPEIDRIVRRARNMTRAEVLLAAGGFHLRSVSREEAGRVAADLVDNGVVHVAPSHCTGDVARQAFADAYGDHYHPSGVGAVFTLEELAP